MVLRSVTYVAERRGGQPASAAMAAQRAAMDRRGENIPAGIAVIPHPPGPGRAEWVVPVGPAPISAILYLHGSGYSKGSPASHRPLVIRLVQETGIAAFVPDYRLTPEHPFPAALEDAMAAYNTLLASFAPEAVAVVGDSAGGGLALALMLAAREEGVPLPACAATLSAWTDLAVTGDPRPDIDDPRVTPDMLRAAAALYLDGADPRDPGASPLYGDLAGLPPLLMQVGEREVLIEDTGRFATNAKAAGVDVTVSVWPGMAHVFQLNQSEEPQAAEAVAEMARFVADRLAPR